MPVNSDTLNSQRRLAYVMITSTLRNWLLCAASIPFTFMSKKSPLIAADRVEKLDYAKRWMRDGLQAVSARAGFVLCEHIDATSAKSLIDAYRRLGKRITYTHIVVKVSADLLARKPEHHKFVARNKKLHAAAVDVGLSVAADQPLAPVLVIKEANKKSLLAISEEVESRAPEVREEFAKTISQWKRWGWLVPFSTLRRLLLRLAASGMNARRKAAGTFQVTNLADVDLFLPLLLGGVSALGMGRVSDRVVPEAGQVVIRPMITLTFSADHAVFDGRAAANFLSDLRADLESCATVLGMLDELGTSSARVDVARAEKQIPQTGQTPATNGNDG